MNQRSISPIVGMPKSEDDVFCSGGGADEKA